jgi:hypothetical protein
MLSTGFEVIAIKLVKAAAGEAKLFGCRRGFELASAEAG